MNNARAFLGCHGEKMQTLEHFSLVYLSDEYEEDKKMQTLEHFSLVYVSNEHEEDVFWTTLEHFSGV